MNYKQIKDLIILYAHRDDLEPFVDGFVSSCSQELDRRFGTTTPVLTLDTDTNDYLTKNSDLYLYWGLHKVAEFTQDAPLLQASQMMFDRAASDMNINYRGEEWDTTPPVMEPYTDAT